MEVTEIQCKSILTKSGLHDSKYSINPYRGCSHACVYCYAPYVLREKRKWGNFVDVKVNAPEILEKELKKTISGNVLISSVTDPYQAVERKYMITRKILEKLKDSNLFISILTKSALVTRDIDLLKQMRCEVGLTITSLNEGARELFEPGASPVKDRINALTQLRRAGIRTYIFFGPILPLITDRDLDAIIETLEELEPGSIYVDRLNLRNISQSKKFMEVLEKNYSKETADRCKVSLSDGEYYNNLRQMIKSKSKNQSKYKFCY